MSHSTIFDFTTLGDWPQDCLDQQIFIGRLQDQLNVLKVYTQVNRTITLAQVSQPTQAQWESAWVLETGLALPIPPTADLIWFDTVNNTFGGIYGTVTGYATVYRREHEYVKGALAYSNQNHSNVLQNSTKSLYDNTAVLPSFTFNLPITTTVLMEFSFFAFVASGTGNFAADFLFDSIKIGTQYINIPPNSGMVETSVTGRYNISYLLDNVLPGSHTVKPLLGVAGSPAAAPTISWGATNNVTSFVLRVYAK